MIDLRPLLLKTSFSSCTIDYLSNFVFLASFQLKDTIRESFPLHFREHVSNTINLFSCTFFPLKIKLPGRATQGIKASCCYSAFCCRFVENKKIEMFSAKAITHFSETGSQKFPTGDWWWNEAGMFLSLCTIKSCSRTQNTPIIVHGSNCNLYISAYQWMVGGKVFTVCKLASELLFFSSPIQRWSTNFVFLSMSGSQIPCEPLDRFY